MTLAWYVEFFFRLLEKFQKIRDKYLPLVFSVVSSTIPSSSSTIGLDSFFGEDFVLFAKNEDKNFVNNLLHY